MKDLFYKAKIEFEIPSHNDFIEIEADSKTKYVRTTFVVAELLPDEFVSQLLGVMNSKHKDKAIKNTKNYSLCLRSEHNFIYQLEGEKIKFVFNEDDGLDSYET